MTRRRDVLAEILKALQQAADRLRVTHAGVSDWFPLTPDRIVALPPGEQERLDAYAIRYARCQDLLFPAMRAFARAQLEPKADGTFLELHALMQKQGIVGEPRDWERQRALRNAVSHEYPDPDAIADILNGIHAATPEILSNASTGRRGACRILVDMVAGRYRVRNLRLGSHIACRKSKTRGRRGQLDRCCSSD